MEQRTVETTKAFPNFAGLDAYHFYPYENHYTACNQRRNNKKRQILPNIETRRIESKQQYRKYQPTPNNSKRPHDPTLKIAHKILIKR